jgi:hypothetical protein
MDIEQNKQDECASCNEDRRDNLMAAENPEAGMASVEGIPERDSDAMGVKKKPSEISDHQASSSKNDHEHEEVIERAADGMAVTQFNDDDAENLHDHMEMLDGRTDSPESHVDRNYGLFTQPLDDADMSLDESGDDEMDLFGHEGGGGVLSTQPGDDAISPGCILGSFGLDDRGSHLIASRGYKATYGSSSTRLQESPHIDDDSPDQSQQDSPPENAVEANSFQRRNIFPKY